LVINFGKTKKQEKNTLFSLAFLNGYFFVEKVSPEINEKSVINNVIYLGR